jgi:hypothetical protein
MKEFMESRSFATRAENAFIPQRLKAFPEPSQPGIILRHADSATLTEQTRNVKRETRNVMRNA